MKKLKWKKLLCDKRERPSNNAVNRDATRNEFEADYDRIVGSSSLRRLQDKAQVYPLQSNDFVRTRLTHSIEVSGIARSLGKQVGRKLLEMDKIKSDDVDKIAAILQTAGLVHDIGNPPFGHFGESVIRKWFNDHKKILKGLTKAEKNDFFYFDGNVQTLRVVTKLQMLNDLYGANFTYATLAVLMKYPWDSKTVDGQKKKKFGYFQLEKEIVENIRENTGLRENVRHPLTYLLEAADDITYIGDDIEDGVNKKLIAWKRVYCEFRFKFRRNKEIKKNIIDKIKNIEISRKADIPEKEIADSKNFRNILQGFMIQRVIKSFIANYKEIMSGVMRQKDLFKCDEDVSEIIEWYEDLMKKYCYSCAEILDLELSARTVISTMLDNYIKMALVKKGSDGKDPLQDITTYENRLYESISDNYKYIAENKVGSERRTYCNISQYDKIALCVDYIAGMTDSYAVRQYRKMMGIGLSLKG